MQRAASKHTPHAEHSTMNPAPLQSIAAVAAAMFNAGAANAATHGGAGPAVTASSLVAARPLNTLPGTSLLQPSTTAVLTYTPLFTPTLVPTFTPTHKLQPATVRGSSLPRAAQQETLMSGLPPHMPLTAIQLPFSAGALTTTSATATNPYPPTSSLTLKPTPATTTPHVAHLSPPVTSAFPQQIGGPAIQTHATTTPPYTPLPTTFANTAYTPLPITTATYTPLPITTAAYTPLPTTVAYPACSVAGQQPYSTAALPYLPTAVASFGANTSTSISTSSGAPYSAAYKISTSTSTSTSSSFTAPYTYSAAYIPTTLARPATAPTLQQATGLPTSMPTSMPTLPITLLASMPAATIPYTSNAGATSATAATTVTTFAAAPITTVAPTTMGALASFVPASPVVSALRALPPLTKLAPHCEPNTLTATTTLSGIRRLPLDCSSTHATGATSTGTNANASVGAAASVTTATNASALPAATTTTTTTASTAAAAATTTKTGKSSGAKRGTAKGKTGPPKAKVGPATPGSATRKKKKSKVSRPLNSFMVFGSEYRKLLQNEFPDQDNKVISKMLGAKWKSITPQQKEKYVSLCDV